VNANMQRELKRELKRVGISPPHSVVGLANTAGSKPADE